MTPTADDLRRILRAARRIAVVGLGDNPARPAYSVANYLQQQGYVIAPVHPTAGTVLGVPVYRSLEDAAADGPVDIVDIFRRSEAIPDLVDGCIAVHPRLVWLQLGIRHDEAVRRIEAAGVPVVQNRCLAVELHLLAGDP